MLYEYSFKTTPDGWVDFLLFGFPLANHAGSWGCSQL